METLFTGEYEWVWVAIAIVALFVFLFFAIRRQQIKKGTKGWFIVSKRTGQPIYGPYQSEGAALASPKYDVYLHRVEYRTGE